MKREQSTSGFARKQWAQGPMGTLLVGSIICAVLGLVALVPLYPRSFGWLLGTTTGGNAHAKTGKYMEWLVAGLLTAWDEDGRWPATIAELQERFPYDISEKLYHSMRGDRRGLPLPHFLYCRPTDGEPESIHAHLAETPLLFEDPACPADGSLLVCFGDGHREIWHPTDIDALWQRVQDLAVQADGISQQEWQAFWRAAAADGLLDRQRC